MKAYSYLIQKSFKNQIKQIFRKPIQLVIYSLLIGFVIFAMIMSMSGSDGGKTSVQGLNIYTYFTTFFAFFLVLQGLYGSADKLTSSFRMADINILFMAPTKPSSNLIYSQVVQMMKTSFVALIMLFQVPNLRNMLGFELREMLIFILAFLMMLCLNPLYLLCSFLSIKYEKAKSIIKGIVYGTIGALAVAVLYQFMQVKEPMIALNRVVSSPIMTYIPVVGWINKLFYSTIHPIDAYFYISIILLVLLAVICLYIVLKNEYIDYYEEAIKTAEQGEVAVKAVRSGKNANRELRKLKDKKVKNTKYTLSKTGSLAIIDKQILELKRKGEYPMNLQTLLMAAGVVVATYFIPTIEEFPSGKILMILVGYIYLLFIFSASGMWGREVDKHYIYILPCSKIKKVFSVILINALDPFKALLLGYTVACIYFKMNLIDGILASVVIFIVALLIQEVDMVSRLLLGRMSSRVLKIYIRMFITLFILAPMIVGGVVNQFVLNNSSTSTIVLSGIIGLIFVGLTAIPAMQLFNNYEEI